MSPDYFTADPQAGPLWSRLPPQDGAYRFVRRAGFIQLQLQIPEATALGHVEDSVTVHITAGCVGTVSNEPSTTSAGMGRRASGQERGSIDGK